MILDANKTEVKASDGTRLILDNGVQLIHIRCPTLETRAAWIDALRGADSAPPQGVVDWLKTVQYKVSLMIMPATKLLLQMMTDDAPSSRSGAYVLTTEALSPCVVLLS